MNGSCLVSQDLRRRVLKGHIDVPQRNLALKEDLAFADPVLESIVQPSSLDLTIGDETQTIKAPVKFGVAPNEYHKLIALTDIELVKDREGEE